jgi:hypothetical protein
MKSTHISSRRTQQAILLVISRISLSQSMYMSRIYTSKLATLLPSTLQSRVDSTCSSAQSARTTIARKSKKAGAKYQGKQGISGILSGLESLGIEVGRYVTNKDMSPRAIDEAYDELPVQYETSAPELVAGLDAFSTRQNVSSLRSRYESRVDENGSPAPLRSAPLRVIDPMPTLIALEVPRREGVPHRSSSSMYAVSSASPASPSILKVSPLVGSDQVPLRSPRTPPVIKKPNSFHDSGKGKSVMGDRKKWSAPSVGRVAENESLSQQLLNEQRSDLAVATSTRR